MSAQSPVSAFVIRHLDNVVDETGYRVFVAISPEMDLIGNLLVTVEHPPIASVCRLFVHPDSRRHGVATGLIHAALSYAAENQCDSCNLLVMKNNRPAIELYRKLGFSLIMEYDSKNFAMGRACMPLPVPA